MNDPVSAVALLALTIAILNLALNVGPKIWGARDETISRISLLVQLASFLVLFYVLFLLTRP